MIKDSFEETLSNGSKFVCSLDNVNKSFAQILYDKGVVVSSVLKFEYFSLRSRESHAFLTLNRVTPFDAQTRVRRNVDSNSNLFAGQI